MKPPKLLDGGIAIDDRGKLSFVNDFDFERVKRFYMVENHKQGFIRAWHGHRKEAKYIYVVSGSALIGIVPIIDDSNDITYLKAAERYVLSADKPQILYVPPGYANGAMTLTDDAKIMYFSSTAMGEFEDDDIRFSHDQWNIWDIHQR